MYAMTVLRRMAFAIFSAFLVASVARAQAPAKDPSARLRESLPPDVAERVLARIDDARARQLPAEALQNRALKFVAKGVAPANIERSVNEQLERMEVARAVLVAGRQTAPAADEIEAGAEAMRKGVDGASVSALAQSAPSGRGLGVPLFVIGSLADRGVPVGEALQRVLARLQQKASDADLESMSGDLPAKALAGQARASDNRVSSARSGASGRPSTAGAPAGIPGNGGRRANPGQSHRPPKTSN
jgi:hypothetical protein